MMGLALTACSGSHAADLVHGPSKIRVDSPDLIAFKKQQTDVPNCPKVTDDRVDAGMPAVTIPCLGGGRSVDVAGLRGPMIVNFWASWCTECRREMPALAAYARHQSTVTVVGIDMVDQQPAAALQLARNSSVGYPLLADPDGRLVGQEPLPRNPGMPYTVFVDATGKVVHIEAGALVKEQDVADAVQQYLGTGG
jgi:thiol-disulfide isomerase/thioredoxin